MIESASKFPRVFNHLRDRSRPVVVLGPELDDPRMVRQAHAWVGALPEAGIKDRDIVVVEVPSRGDGNVGGEPMRPEEAEELRRFFAVADENFLVVLVGRDGAEKVRWTEPVSAQEIFGKVDGMPMRQQEVQARGGGSE